MSKPRIGFIGTGWVGGNLADAIEARGYPVVRYSFDPKYVGNQAKIADCEIVGLAVWTPTTEKGFDDSHLIKAARNLVAGQTAVIKSTVLPGTTEKLQEMFPDVYFLHNPEFLREAHVVQDIAEPERNIIGLPRDTPAYRQRAEEVLEVLPSTFATRQMIMTSRESALVKYYGNVFLMSKLLMMNAFYDTTLAAGGSWEVVRRALILDSRIGESHTQPIGKDGTRGAGGHCFPKDFEAYTRLVADMLGDKRTLWMLEAMRDYNNALLIESGKDLDILKGIYGPFSLDAPKKVRAAL